MIDHMEIAVLAAMKESDDDVRPAILLPWPTFKVRARRSDRWMQAKLPSELEEVVAEDDTPSELLDIIRWSLTRHVPQAESSPTTSRASHASHWSGQGDANTTAPTSPASQSSSLPLAKRISQNMSNERMDVLTDHSPVSEDKKDKQPSVLARLVSGFISPTSTSADSKKDEVKDGRVTRIATIPTPPATTECTSCFDDIPVKEATKLSCTHSYCVSCFITLVMTAIQTETAFPPRCCLTKIPLKTVIAPLTTEQKEVYAQKAAEYATDLKIRWYCHKADCGKWIPPSKLNGLRTIRTQKCPYCSSEQCLVCRGDAHPASNDCPEDFGLEATLREAENRGYKRCFSCRTVVELTDGCRHMTCKCGAEFCYVCGKKWQTCACTSADHVAQQADIRRRREQRDTLGRAEEEEIIRAIAQVEALIERDRLEEERREAERIQAEELELARLEELRLQELEQRRKEEEEAERQRVDILRASVGERLVFLQAELQKLVHYQQSTLTSRHESEMHAWNAKHEEGQATRAAEAESLHLTMTTNIERRRQTVCEKHATELSQMSALHEEEEDDIQMWLQLHFKDKSNREAREKRMLENLANEQGERRQKLETTHKRQLETLQKNFDIEMQGLERSKSSRDESAHDELQRELGKISSRSERDRQWTEFIVERRNILLQEHGRLMRNALDAGQDSIGLTEAKAFQVMPPWPQPSARIHRSSHRPPPNHEPAELPSTSTPASNLMPAPLHFETQPQTNTSEAPNNPSSPTNQRRRPREREHVITSPSSLEAHEIDPLAVNQPRRYYQNNNHHNQHHHLPDPPQHQSHSPAPPIPSRSPNRKPTSRIHDCLPQEASSSTSPPLPLPLSITTTTPTPTAPPTSSWTSLPSPPTPAIIERMDRLADPRPDMFDPNPKPDFSNTVSSSSTGQAWTHAHARAELAWTTEEEGQARRSGVGGGGTGRKSGKWYLPRMERVVAKVHLKGGGSGAGTGVATAATTAAAGGKSGFVVRGGP